MIKAHQSGFFKKAPTFWEKKGLISCVLWPISLLFKSMSILRYLAFDLGLAKSESLPVPVIIIGNIRVGGTGKTPIVIAMARELSALGWHPGIISRGYTLNSTVRAGEQAVTSTSLATNCGDEPVLIAKALADLEIPVWIGRHRVECARKMLATHPKCDVIISDDGLQHYRLKRKPSREGGRDIEIVVRDARGEGNGFVLPAGPLRESTDRPRDLTLQTQSKAAKTTPNDLALGEAAYLGHAPLFPVNLRLGRAYRLSNPHEQRSLQEFVGHSILACAGLGNPEKFFDSLRQVGLSPLCLPLPDHYGFEENPFANPAYTDLEAILITEKDAVKCASLNDNRLWVVPLKAQLSSSLMQWIEAVLRR